MDGKEPDEGRVNENQSSEDVFAETFKTAAGEELKTELSPVEDLDKGKEPEAGAPAPGTEPAPEEETKVDATAQRKDESDEAYKQRWLTLQGIYNKDKETFANREAELLSQLEEARKPAAAAVPVPEERKPVTLAEIYDSLSPEDKAELKGYDEEFDVISKMEGKKRELAAAVFKKELEAFKAEILSKLEPATALVKETAQRIDTQDKAAHFDALRKAHSDYEQYRDDGSIVKWIESKPKYLQPALAQTYAEGTVENVIALISDFKKENNITITNPSPESTDNVVDINTQKKKEERKQALTAVTSRRGAVNQSMAVSTDFEGAFDEALNKTGG